jgi:outer membrane protein TolC
MRGRGGWSPFRWGDSKPAVNLRWAGCVSFLYPLIPCQTFPMTRVTDALPRLWTNRTSRDVVRGLLAFPLLNPMKPTENGLTEIAPFGVLARCSLLVGFGLMAGCATYHAKPLDLAAVDSALQAPALDSIRVSSAAIKHPLLAPMVIDGRDGFTPDEVAVMTVITSPRLRALRAQRGVAQAQVVQAGLLPNPQLGYTLDRPHGNAVPGLIDGQSLGLSWEVTSLLSYRDRVKAAKSTRSALDLDIAWQEWQAAQAARLSVYRIVSLEARLPLAKETEAELADALALARKAHELGQLTTPDLAARVETWSLAQDATFALEQELTKERLSLDLALGRPAGAPLRLKPGPDFPELPAGANTAATLLDGFEQRRLDLVALTLGYESTEASLRASIKAQFPKIGLSFARANDTSDVRTRNFGVTMDLPLFDRNQGQIAAATATREQLFDEYVARVAEARAEVVHILANLAITRTQLRTLDAELPELEQISAALDRVMQSRNADAQAVRDARATLLARRTEQARMRQDLLDLAVALEIATGRPLLTHGGAP